MEFATAELPSIIIALALGLNEIWLFVMHSLRELLILLTNNSYLHRIFTILERDRRVNTSSS